MDFNRNFGLVSFVFFLLAVVCIRPTTAIGCYKCTTTGNDSSCRDPFNPGETLKNLYENDCKSGMEGRTGYFPARYCLKVSGYKGKNLT